MFLLLTTEIRTGSVSIIIVVFPRLNWLSNHSCCIYHCARNDRRRRRPSVSPCSVERCTLSSVDTHRRTSLTWMWHSSNRGMSDFQTLLNLADGFLNAAWEDRWSTKTEFCWVLLNMTQLEVHSKMIEHGRPRPRRRRHLIHHVSGLVCVSVDGGEYEQLL